jgi:uncharacterized RDD family membrane protein YckC
MFWVVLTFVIAAVATGLTTSDGGDDSAAAPAITFLVIGFGLPWFFNSVGWSPGKRLVGVEIVGEDMEPPGAGAGLARTLVAAISGAFLGLGYLAAAWDSDTRTWHDRVAGTYVVRKTD